jgi:hypothetical protein
LLLFPPLLPSSLCSSSLLCCLPLLAHACEGRNTTDCRARSTSVDDLPQTLVSKKFQLSAQLHPADRRLLPL